MLRSPAVLFFSRFSRVFCLLTTMTLKCLLHYIPCHRSPTKPIADQTYNGEVAVETNRDTYEVAPDFSDFNWEIRLDAIAVFFRPLPWIWEFVIFRYSSYFPGNRVHPTYCRGADSRYFLLGGPHIEGKPMFTTVSHFWKCTDRRMKPSYVEHMKLLT